MTTKIFDAAGVERDMPWLRGAYGNVTIEQASGQRFALVEIRESDGPAVLFVRVLNEEGAAHAGQPVANHWPDAVPALQDLSGGGLKTMPYPTACVQFVAGDGSTGFGLGGGSYITNPASGGPHTVWVLSPSLPSDVIRGLGWKAGTNHRGPMRLTFQITGDAGADYPEPSVEPGNIGYLVALAAGLPGTWSAAKVALAAKARLDALLEVDDV